MNRSRENTNDLFSDQFFVVKHGFYSQIKGDMASSIIYTLTPETVFAHDIMCLSGCAKLLADVVCLAKLCFVSFSPNGNWNGQNILDKKQSIRSIRPYQMHTGRTGIKFVYLFYSYLLWNFYGGKGLLRRQNGVHLRPHL